jgi:O-acetyl-ADP-ribose deacetylase (regulator of RNase III)
VIEDRVGDIFAQKDLTHICHQANLFHCFGNGIAKEIRERFPWAYEADRRTGYADHDKLGTYNIAYKLPHESGDVPFYIVNMYSQDGMGGKDRQTNYAAMGAILFMLERELRRRSEATLLGIPHGLGCGLASGDWDVVRPIIESAFAMSPVRVVICRLLAPVNPLVCEKCKKFAGWYECLLCQVIFCKCDESFHEHNGKGVTPGPPYVYSTILQDP